MPHVAWKPEIFTIILFSEKVCWLYLELFHLLCDPWQTTCLHWACLLIHDFGIIKLDILASEKKKRREGQFENHHLQLGISKLLSSIIQHL